MVPVCVYSLNPTLPTVVVVEAFAPWPTASESKKCEIRVWLTMLRIVLSRSSEGETDRSVFANPLNRHVSL
jgi:hypothetical protein